MRRLLLIMLFIATWPDLLQAESAIVQAVRATIFQSNSSTSTRLFVVRRAERVQVQKKEKEMANVRYIYRGVFIVDGWMRLKDLRLK